MPTATVSPASTRISSTPAPSASTVMFALSVSTSSRSCPAVTTAPASTNQLRIVPSSIESDSFGMEISIAVAVAVLMNFSGSQGSRSAAAPTIVSASMPKWRVEVADVAGLAEIVDAERLPAASG